MRLENTFLGAEGVGEGTERHLYERGVTHWDDFEPDLLGPTRGERLANYIAEGRDRLAEGDPEYFARRLPRNERWRLYGNFREDACFFDIETTGLDRHRHEVTTVSFHTGGETTSLVAGRDLTAAALRERFDEAALLVTYNGKRFDVPFLEACFDLEVATPHVDLVYPCRRLGYTGGLSGVEDAIGVDRPGPDVGGEEAVRLWRRYQSGRDGALETLLSYNRDDARVLRDVFDAVARELHERRFAPAPEAPPPEP